MNEFLAAFIFDLVVLFVAAALFVRWYRTQISRDAKRKAYQYRFFALRDRAIRLAMEGTMEEEDPKWQRIYAHMNESARAAQVDQMRNGLSFVLGILRNIRPLTKEEIEQVESLPREAQELQVDYVRTVLGVCYEGSFLLRRAVWLGTHFSRIKHWLERRNPVEVRNYRLWRLSAEKLSPGKTCFVN